MKSHFPFLRTGLSGAETAAFNAVCNALTRHYALEFRDGMSSPFREMSLFGHYSETAFRDTLLIRKGNREAHLSFITVRAEMSGPKGQHIELTDHQIWGHKRLGSDHGRILLKRETLQDKASEIFAPSETDFPEDPDFSRRFYVLCDDSELNRKKLNGDFRKAVSDLQQKDIYLEIRNRDLIIGNRKPPDPDAALDIAAFLMRIA